MASESPLHPEHAAALNDKNRENPMSLFRAGVCYFKMKREVLKWDSPIALRNRIRADRSETMHYRTEAYDSSVIHVPYYDFEHLSIAAIRTVLGLHAYRSPKGKFTFDNLNIREFAKRYAHLSYRHAVDGLNQLADAGLISKSVHSVHLSPEHKRRGTDVRLLDPESGLSFDELIENVKREFDAHDQHYWYKRLLDMSIAVSNYEWRSNNVQTFPCPCPLHVKSPTSEDKKSLTVSVWKTDDGKFDSSWTCRRCHNSGKSKTLFLRLYPAMKLEEKRRAKEKELGVNQGTMFPIKDEEPVPDDFDYEGAPEFDEAQAQDKGEQQ